MFVSRKVAKYYMDIYVIIILYNYRVTLLHTMPRYYCVETIILSKNATIQIALDEKRQANIYHSKALFMLLSITFILSDLQFEQQV